MARNAQRAMTSDTKNDPNRTPPLEQGQKQWWQQTMIMRILHLKGPIAVVVACTMMMTILGVLMRGNERPASILDEGMVSSVFGKGQQQQQDEPNTTIAPTTQLQPQETSMTNDAGIRSTLPRDVLAAMLVPPKRRSKKRVQGAGSLSTPWSENANPNTTKFVLNPKCNDPETQTLFQKQPEHTAGNKILTFFLMYYNDVDHMAHQLSIWRQFTPEIKEKVQFLIVDDGSSAGFRAVDVLQAQSDWKDHDIDIVVYEIEQDLVWNIGGVRNLGFFVAATDWVFLIDADTTADTAVLDFVLKKVQNNQDCNNCAYRKFHRIRADGKTFKPHPAAMLITKSAYWAAGGCDEDFVGNYGKTDTHFSFRSDAVKLLTVGLVDEEMQTMATTTRLRESDTVSCPAGITCIPSPDKSTQERPSRDTTPNMALLKKKVRGKVPWSNEYLRFRWKRVW